MAEKGDTAWSSHRPKSAVIHYRSSTVVTCSLPTQTPPEYTADNQHCICGASDCISLIIPFLLGFFFSDFLLKDVFLSPACFLLCVVYKSQYFKVLQQHSKLFISVVILIQLQVPFIWQQATEHSCEFCPHVVLTLTLF